jgi:two-component system response regulator DctR
MNQPTTILLCDDDEGVRGGLGFLLRQMGYAVQSFASGPELLDFLDNARQPLRAVIVLDMKMEPMPGTVVHDQLLQRHWGSRYPVIFLSGHGDIPLAVAAMSKGALNFVEKPHTNDALLPIIAQAFEKEAQWFKSSQRGDFLRSMWDSLTTQQRKVTLLVADGDINKVIAAKLNIVERTVEVHRAKAFEKLGVDSPASLATTIANMRSMGMDLRTD